MKVFLEGDKIVLLFNCGDSCQNPHNCMFKKLIVTVCKLNNF